MPTARISLHGLASGANCGQAFPDGLCVSSFPWWVAVCRHSQLTHFVGARLHMYVYMHMCSTVSVTCQCLLHIWHLEWLGSLCFTATAVTWVWNRYQNKSQCWKLTLERKTLPPFLPGDQIHSLLIRSLVLHCWPIFHGTTTSIQIGASCAIHGIRICVVSK